MNLTRANEVVNELEAKVAHATIARLLASMAPNDATRRAATTAEAEAHAYSITVRDLLRDHPTAT